MFALAGDVRGKKILEVGCGEGVVSVQLAYCGAQVKGIDISGASINVARRRAALNGVEVEFSVENVVEAESLGKEEYDIVWCDLILHHLVDSLDKVICKIDRALKPEGLFIAREPVAYARWLKAFRKITPTQGEATEDEQPLRDSEIAITRRHFPDLHLRHYRILARADCVTKRLALIRMLARLDNALFMFPRIASLAGNVVMWSRKMLAWLSVSLASLLTSDSVEAILWMV